MTHRSNDRGPATRRPSPPGMEFLYEVQHAFPVAPIEVGTLGGRHQLMTLDGVRFEGPRISGRHLPGTVVEQTIQANGIMTHKALLAFATDDGHYLFARSMGIASIAPENALALASGQIFDPEAFYVRGYVLFEAADDGPYSWLNRSLCVTKTIRLPEGVYTTVWQLL